MKWVVTYDIVDDRVRHRVSTLLEAYGSRVQESVFECGLSVGLLKELRSRVGAALPAEGANVRFYRVCRDCEEVAFGFGSAREGLFDDFVL